jgi:hypothetical protein
MNSSSNRSNCASRGGASTVVGQVLPKVDQNTPKCAVVNCGTGSNCTDRTVSVTGGDLNFGCKKSLIRTTNEYRLDCSRVQPLFPLFSYRTRESCIVNQNLLGHNRSSRQLPVLITPMMQALGVGHHAQRWCYIRTSPSPEKSPSALSTPAKTYPPRPS